MYEIKLQRDIFVKCLNEMRGMYGNESIGESKSGLFWNELKEFSPKQILNIMTILIGSCKFAPTIEEVREKCSMLREKIRAHERDQERQDAKDFWEGTFHSSEVKAMVQTIKIRMEDKLTDDEWRQFKEMIGGVGKQSKCKRCDDTGAYFDKNTKPYLCRHPKVIPIGAQR